MSEWESIEFAQLYEVPSKNGMMAPSRVRGSGALLVNMREIFAFDRISDQRMERVPLPERNPDQWLLKAGDLLFARQSLTLEGAGKVSLVLAPPEPMTFESHIIRVRLDTSKADPRFYYYLFRSAVGRSLIGGIVEQVAASGIRASDLGRLVVPYPGRSEQRRIADVLSYLDDLIETNALIAGRLTALARALYDRLVRSEPATTPFAQTVEILSGGTPKTRIAEYWGGDIPWYSVVDAPQGGSPWVLGTSKTITSTGLENSPARILPERTTIISARGTVGKLALTGQPMAMNQSCYGLRSLVGKQGVFTYFSSQDIVDELRRSAHGSVFDTITRDSLSRVSVRLPDSAAIDAFEGQAAPLLDLARALTAEGNEVTRTRDELLPLLMSGEVRVAEEVAVA